MSKFSLVLALAPVVVVTGLEIQACLIPTSERPTATPIAKGIVLLDNGLFVEAPDDSVAKRLLDWLEKPEKSRQVFYLGGVQFEGRSIVPTTATRLRVPTLVKMLTAYPYVNAKFMGFTSPTQDPLLDQAVEIARANWVVAELVKSGINPARLSAQASIQRTGHPNPYVLPERVDLELSKK